ncbi:MAG TPA: hypothetical protein VNH41_04280, partial [Steroidobacteraceae bacterium]|nr:hypothetical protein [Steroidobacteraceae bacterium]
LTQRKRTAVTVDAVATGAHPALTNGSAGDLLRPKLVGPVVHEEHSVLEGQVEHVVSVHSSTDTKTPGQ